MPNELLDDGDWSPLNPFKYTKRAAYWLIPIPLTVLYLFLWGFMSNAWIVLLASCLCVLATWQSIETIGKSKEAEEPRTWQRNLLHFLAMLLLPMSLVTFITVILNLLLS